MRDLDAAGIRDPRLRLSYRHCRRVAASSGRTFFLATSLLPPAKRPYVHALYAFARVVDEVVDDLADSRSMTDKQARLDAWTVATRAATRSDWTAGESDDLILSALADTVRRWQIDPVPFDAFLGSMRLDLTVMEYATYEDLARYMDGSAVAIAQLMLPILGHPAVSTAVVAPYAADLAVAFQLSNFIRDVGEDLLRGRIYLPMADLAAFGVDREHLMRGVVDGPVRRLLAYEIARTREVYRSAQHGIRLLDPTSQDCVRTALRVYDAILDEVGRNDYRVLDRRVSVGPLKRARVAVPALVRARSARRASVTGRPPGDPARSTSTA